MPAAGGRRPFICRLALAWIFVPSSPIVPIFFGEKPKPEMLGALIQTAKSEASFRELRWRRRRLRLAAVKIQP